MKPFPEWSNDGNTCVYNLEHNENKLWLAYTQTAFLFRNLLSLFISFTSIKLLTKTHFMETIWSCDPYF